MATLRIMMTKKKETKQRFCEKFTQTQNHSNKRR